MIPLDAYIAGQSPQLNAEFGGEVYPSTDEEEDDAAEH